MRILAVLPHFDPDVAPTGVIASRLVEELGALGHRTRRGHVVALVRASRCAAGVARQVGTSRADVLGPRHAGASVPDRRQAQHPEEGGRLRGLLRTRRGGGRDRRPRRRHVRDDAAATDGRDGMVREFGPPRAAGAERSRRLSRCRGRARLAQGPHAHLGGQRARALVVRALCGRDRAVSRHAGEPRGQDAASATASRHPELRRRRRSAARPDSRTPTAPSTACRARPS